MQNHTTNTYGLISQGTIFSMLLRFGIKRVTIAKWLSCNSSTITNAINSNVPLRTIVPREIFNCIFDSNLPDAMNSSKEDLLKIHIVPYLKDSNLLSEQLESLIERGYDIFVNTLLHIASYDYSFAPFTEGYSEVDVRGVNINRKHIIRFQSDLYCVLAPSNQQKLDKLCELYTGIINFYKGQLNQALYFMNNELLFDADDECDDEYDDDTNCDDNPVHE